MFFPYSDDNPLERFPIVNLSLIGINVVVYLYCLTSDGYQEIIETYGFYANDPQLLQMLTSTFLHAGLLHLAGNMWFLWIFGDNVEGRMGSVLYLLFYLACAFSADGLHALMVQGEMTRIPTVGASGAIFGVMAAYMIFYPLAKINFFYWVCYLYTGVIQIPALIVIAIWFFWQFALATLTQGQRVEVAYWEHLGGFGLGLLIAILFQVFRSFKILKPIPFRAETEKLPQMESNSRAFSSAFSSPVVPLSARVQEGMQIRRTTVDRDKLQKARLLVSRFISQNNLPKVIKYYSLFEQKWPTELLPEGQQWEVAEILRNAGNDILALEAYRKIVDHYSGGIHWSPACLQTGRLYLLHHNYARAKQYLELLIQEMPSATEVEEARQELAKIESLLGATEAISGKEQVSSMGSYLVLRQTFEKLDPSGVGDLIAKFTGEIRIDTRARVVRGQGILAEGIPEKGIAEALAKQLQQEGIPVLVANERQLLIYPEAIEVKAGELSDSGAVLKTYSDEYAFEWSDLWLMSCVRVRTQHKREVSSSPAIVVGPGVATSSVSSFKHKTVTDSKRVRVLDLFCTEPFLHLRVREDHFNYSYLSEDRKATNRVSNFTTLVKDMIRWAPGSHVGPGIDRLLSEESFKGLTLNSIKDLDRYNFWLVQLCHLQPGTSPGTIPRPD